MNTLTVSIPAKKVSAWIAETDPKFAREWLASLPMADSTEAGREIYQSLYTLNRLELDVHDRFDLIELYRGPVDVVTTSLQPHFNRLSLPLSSKRRQLSELIRQLHMEMANGYKLCLTDLGKSWKPWGKKLLSSTSLERALRYLGDVLLRSYQIYSPCPPGVWKEIHELYRFAETTGRHEDPIGAADEPGAEQSSVIQRYMQILLLGLCNPYQLPQNQSLQINRFLEIWAGKAKLQTNMDVGNPVGHFLVDWTSDAPPIPFPRGAALQTGPHLRALNAIELVRTVHSFINHIRKGRSARSLQMGLDCLDSACLDLLQRLIRSWALVARRRHPRIKRNSHVFLCVGVHALHFFSSGQRPFSVPVQAEECAERDELVNLANQFKQVANESFAKERDETYIALDEVDRSNDDPPAQPTKGFSVENPSPTEIYRIDRWRVRDDGPQGMLLSRSGETVTSVRVGDTLGLQHVNDMGNWAVAVVRWVKSQGVSSLEMGVELLASNAVPVAVKPVGLSDGEGGGYTQALLLPAMEAAHCPETLLVTSGLYQPKRDYYLIEENKPPRLVRPLKLLQHNVTFEQIVFADVLHD
jgi:cyclic-di-GMP-binding protein